MQLETPFIASYWQKLDNIVLCQLCPRECRLKDGQRGFCFIRQNQNGKLILTAYGKSSGFAVDPIEKKPLNHFLPGSKIFSFGTVGCNMGCKFCQNWEISKTQQQESLFQKATPADIAIMAKKLDCPSVAFTYNDPVIFAEYVIDAAKACHELGIKTVAVTAGYIKPEPAIELFSYIDATNIDLKGFTRDFYRKFCLADTQPVLDLLIYLKKKTNVWVELTTLLIPGLNDSEQELHALSEWIAQELGPDVPLHFTAFTPNYRLNKPATPISTLLYAREIALSKGLHYVYTGNVADISTQSTYCPNCKTCVIEREWHTVKFNKIINNACPICKTPIAGYFE